MRINFRFSHFRFFRTFAHLNTMGGSQSQRTVTQPEENATNAKEKKESWLDKLKRICFPDGCNLGSAPMPGFPVEKLLENRFVWEEEGSGRN